MNLINFIQTEKETEKRREIYKIEGGVVQFFPGQPIRIEGEDDLAYMIQEKGSAQTRCFFTATTTTMKLRLRVVIRLNRLGTLSHNDTITIF